MDEANAWYQSLLQQGYNVNQAAVYTQEHYPHFIPPSTAPTPQVAAAPTPEPAVQVATTAAQPDPAGSSMDPNVMAMMMMNQQNQQMMMQQQTMLAQSQQSGGGAGGQQIVINASSNAAAGGMIGNGKTLGMGYLLWCCCFIFLCGIHRFYYNRPVSGIIYLFTFGFLGIGQIYDLITMQELQRAA